MVLDDLLKLLNPHEMEVVGDFNIRGKSMLGDGDDRIMSLSWEDFQSLKNIVAVVCGLDKKNAILGALRTALISRLIIDDQTALALLEESED